MNANHYIKKAYENNRVFWPRKNKANFKILFISALLQGGILLDYLFLLGFLEIGKFFAEVFVCKG